MLRLTLTLAILATLSSAHAQPAPDARQCAVTDTLHGVSIADPYRWLESIDAPDVRTWADAQNAAAESFAGDGVAARAARILSYSEVVTVRQLRPAGDNTFFLRGWAGSPYEGLYVGDPNGLARWLDGAHVAHGEQPGPDRTLRYWPSPDGRLVLALTAPRSSNWGELRLIEAASGRVLMRRDDIQISGTTADWIPDGRSFVYAGYERENDAPVRGRILRVGLDGQATVVFGPIADGPNRQRMLTPTIAPDRDRLFVEATSGTSGDSDLYMLDANGAAPIALAQDEGQWTYLGARGDSAWVYTNADAANGRVVRFDGLSRMPHMREVISEGAGAIAGGSQVGGNAFGMFGDRIALLYREDAVPVIRIFDLNGRRRGELPVSPTGSVWSGFLGDPRRAELTYQFLGVSDPSTIYRVDLHSVRQAQVSASVGGVAPGDIVAERIFVTRPDGARVPVVIAYRRGMTFDRPRRLMMYGYGAFGWVSFLWYQPHVVDFLMHDDGVFVVAGVRGGGEFGSAWHEAGRRLNRQVAIDDYVAVAEHLIAAGYTRSDQFVANGGSISGGLAGAALNQRPDLFGAGVLDYPALDLIRYPSFGAARYWTDELGSPDNAADFAMLRALSPYHNIDPNRCPPPTLVRIGMNDTTVTPMHGFKYTARLQAAARACEAPVYLDLMEGAGHNYGSTPAEIAHTHAVALEFLDRVLPSR